MTSYSFGDIILVPFPFTDQTSVKKRPYEVISQRIRPSGDVLSLQNRILSPKNPVFSEKTGFLVLILVMRKNPTTNHY